MYVCCGVITITVCVIYIVTGRKGKTLPVKQPTVLPSPEEKVVVASNEAAPEKPVEKPAETPAETPAEKPAETPAAEPALPDKVATLEEIANVAAASI